MGYYHAAQICENGHVISSYAETNVDGREIYCSKCGSKTIMNCQYCHQPIRGSESEYGYLYEYEAPAYCYNCGKPYPWTESALQSAKELINEDENLNQAEKQQFCETFPDLIVELPTPKTQVAAARFKKLLGKTASYTSEGIRSIFVDIASEAIKRSLGF